MSERAGQPGATSVEHQTLLTASNGMERILARLASDEPQDWEQEIGGQVRAVSDAIMAHRSAAESSDGLLHHVECSAGHTRSLTEALAGHEQLAADVEATFQLLQESSDISTVRKRCEKIQVELQRHIDVMGDLLYDDSVEAESGIGD